MAAEKSLARLGTDHFDALYLHNPDSVGYSSDAAWKGMAALKSAKLTNRLGIAPGPANGFSLDLIQCFERFSGLVDEAMIILGPMEPWPGGYVLPVAEKNGVKLIARVVDYGGLFHDDVKPGHQFGHGDHRTFRPAGWVEAGSAKIEQMRPLAEKYGVTMLQLACLWTLNQTAVKSVIPTFIQEVGPNTKLIEAKIDELASLPNLTLSPEDCETIRRIGDKQSTNFGISDSLGVIKLEDVITRDSNPDNMDGGSVSKTLVLIPTKTGTTTFKLYKFWEQLHTAKDSARFTTYTVEVKN